MAALVAVHANEPATTCIALAQRALAAGPRIVPEPTDLPWFAQATDRARLGRRARRGAGPARRRGGREPRDGRPGPLRHEPVAARLAAAAPRRPAGRRGRRPHGARGAPTSPRPPLYRKLAAAILVNASIEQGELEQAQSVLDGFGARRGARARRPRPCCASRAGACAWPRSAPTEALADILAAGRIVARHRVDAARATWPGARAPRWPTPRWASARRACAWPRRRSSSRAPSAASARSGSRCAPPASWPAAREGEALLRESVDCLERAGVALERARALAELGVLVRATGRRAEARAMLREALDVAHHAGAAPLADLAEAELRATGAKPRRVALSGVEALTASERRVAELAGDGLTNREIAQALFVTMRTVEGHLTRVFAKLALQLARRAARRPARAAVARRGAGARANVELDLETPALTERTRKPSRSSSARAPRLSASVVPVSARDAVRARRARRGARRARGRSRGAARRRPRPAPCRPPCHRRGRWRSARRRRCARSSRRWRRAPRGSRGRRR